jgi:hypothetical protein
VNLQDAARKKKTGINVRRVQISDFEQKKNEKYRNFQLYNPLFK